MSVYCGGDIIIEAKDKIEMSCTDFTLNASNSVNVESGANMTLKAGANQNLEAGAMMTAKASLIKLN